MYNFETYLIRLEFAKKVQTISRFINIGNMLGGNKIIALEKL